MLHVMDALVTARRNRIEAAGEHVPDVIWQILLLAGAIAVGYTYLFGAHSFKIHLAITGLIAATISLVFVLIIALDYPFRGEVAVGDDAFVSVRATRTMPNGMQAASPSPGGSAERVPETHTNTARPVEAKPAAKPETPRPETPRPEAARPETAHAQTARLEPAH